MKLHPKITDARAKRTFLHLQEDFIKVHGTNYNYDYAVYQGVHVKIKILCSKHGMFEQTPGSHKAGNGCPTCGQIKFQEGNLLKSKKARDSFIKKAEIVHSEKYNYNKAVYTKTHDKVIIICPKHGEFKQTPANHLKGKGCSECGAERTKKANYRRSQIAANEFIIKAEKRHGKRYNYDKVVYESTHKKVTITCPLHGDFRQTPAHHLLDNECPKCGRISMAKKLNHKAREKFISSVRKIHNDKYIYTNVVYKESHIPVEIICPEHGAFRQSPGNHLAGKGCAKCGKERVDFANAKRTEKARLEFRDRANEYHNYKYDYSLVKYISSSKKVIITCKEHGEFKQTPNSHLRSGCPSCAESGFDISKPAFLYYLKVCGGIAYKVGITNRTIEERFGGDMSKIDILKTWYFEDGLEAKIKEQRILKEFKYAKWTGSNLLSDGNSELFAFDVLGLDI